MLAKAVMHKEIDNMAKRLWEQDWDEYFEIQELVAKEAFIFKVRIQESLHVYVRIKSKKRRRKVVFKRVKICKPSWSKDVKMWQ